MQYLLFVLIAVNPHQALSLVDQDGRSYCTAVRISEEFVLTAAHCVVDTDNVIVQCNDKPNPAQVIKTDDKADLALVQLGLSCSSPITKLAKTEPEQGEMLYAIGCPSGECDMVTAGVAGKYMGLGRLRRLAAAIPAWFGNSGGPLLNAAGELVGITSSGVCLNRGLIECFTMFVPSNSIWVFLLK